jgi:hypothetical protein
VRDGPRISVVREGLPKGVLYRVQVRYGGDGLQMGRHAYTTAPPTVPLKSHRFIRRYVDFDGRVNCLGGGMQVQNFFKQKKSAMADYVELEDSGWYWVDGDALSRIEGEPPTVAGKNRVLGMDSF